MFLLFEHEAQNDLSRLEVSWRRDETFAFLPDRSSVYEEWIRDAASSLPPEWQERHVLVLTSGSTGEPKVIVASKRRAEDLAGVIHEAQDNDDVEETIVALPLTYCYALVNQWLWAAVRGRRVVPTRGFKDPDAFHAALRDARNAMLCLVGAQVGLLERHFGPRSFPGVIRLNFAGGPFPQAEIAAIRRRFPNAEIFNNYGCAEAMPRLTVRRVIEPDVDGSNVGHPLPGVELRDGGDGEIGFRSPFQAVGCIDLSGFHAFRPDQWIATGDIGTQAGDGSWRLIGRADQVFKRYGEKIVLAWLEGGLAEVWTGQAACYRERDAAGEEGHVLVLAPAPDAQQMREILHHFRVRLPRVQWPLRVESVAEMPLLPNGKTDIVALAADGRDRREVHWRQRI